MVHWVSGILNGLGPWTYGVVFALIYAETGLCLLVPAETALVVASFMAARGELSLPLLIGVAITAAIAGDFTGYELGFHVARRRLAERGRFLFLRKKDLVPVESYLARHGGKTVFFGRFLSLLRVAVPIVAGMSGMSRWVFLGYNIAGGIVWATTFALLGYQFGRSWERLHRWFHGVGLAILLGVVVAVWIARRLQRRRRDRNRPEPPASDQGGSPSPAS